MKAGSEQLLFVILTCVSLLKTNNRINVGYGYIIQHKRRLIFPDAEKLPKCLS